MSTEHPFEPQARACDRLGSPFTGFLCRALARLIDDKTATGCKVLNWPGNPGPDALALRLTGALHALVLSGRDAELAAIYPPNEAAAEMIERVVAGALVRHDEFILAFLANAPQTNEIARSAMLLPGFLMVARETGLPLDIAEIGASAGLNLYFDRFAIRYGETLVGPALSPVQLAPEIRAKPPLEGDLTIASRRGCDIAPVDLGDPQARLRLRSYIWPDQPQRLQRLDAAITIAKDHPQQVEKADAAAFVGAFLSQRRPGQAAILYHSIMWQYMPDATQRAILGMLDEAGADASATMPLAHLRMEPLGGPDGYAMLMLTTWPGGETRHLAKCDFHGRWIEWL